MQYFKKIFNYQKHFSKLEIFELSLFAILTIGFTIFFAFVNVLNGDEREHLTASFYIYKGYDY